MPKPKITPEMFEGLNFDERVALRRDLISKYGTSLAVADEETGNLFGSNKKKVMDAEGNELPAVGDEDAFKGMDFKQRVEIRQKMIAAYGSSLPQADAEESGGKKNKEEDSSKSSFKQRVGKRRIIAEILENPNISSQKKTDIRENKEEYIEDPNIFVSNDGNIKYITDSTDRKRVVYEHMPSSKIEIDKKDTYTGGWGSALSRAKKMNKTSFPVCYVPWNNKKEYFQTHHLDEVEAVRSIINDKEFYPVRYYL